MGDQAAAKRPMLDQVALGVTVGFAVLTAVFWVWSLLGIAGSTFAESAMQVTTTVVMVGGVAMGLLYLRRRLAASSA